MEGVSVNEDNKIVVTEWYETNSNRMGAEGYRTKTYDRISQAYRAHRDLKLFIKAFPQHTDALIDLDNQIHQEELDEQVAYRVKIEDDMLTTIRQLREKHNDYET